MVTFRRWLTFLKIPLALFGVGVFFSLYNRFILDAKLEDLKISLSVLDAATGIGQAEAALLLMDQALVAQMAEEELNLKQIATMQYAQGTLASDDLSRPVADSQMMVATLAEDQAVGRARFLTVLDGMVTGVQTAVQRARLLPRQWLGGELSEEVDEKQLREALRQERLGLLVESSKIYEQLLRDFPNYTGRITLKLRLGYLYQRLRNLDRAETLYREALRETREVAEAKAAQRMLANLSQVRTSAKGVKALENQLLTLGKGRKRQRVAFELGSLLIQLYDFNQAANMFREAVLADPKGEFALVSLFKEGWCLRNAGRFEEALNRLVEITQKYPETPWVGASYQQIAEIYKATGDYEAAAEVYEKAIEKAQDVALVAILHAQAGSTYRYDLKQPEKAEKHFRSLARSFPASVYSSAEQQLRQIETRHGIPSSLSAFPATRTTLPQPPRTLAPEERDLPQVFSPMLAEGTPVMKWLEGFLPTFIDIFMSRLSRYMQAVGETEITRRFTEQEFEQLVIRRIQQRFPRQVAGMTVKIRSDGFIGSGTVQLGILSFPVRTRIGVTIIQERPHAVIHEVKIGKLVMPKSLRKILEKRVNESINRARYPLRVKEYKLSDGFADISVMLDEKNVGGPGFTRGLRR